MSTWRERVVAVATVAAVLVAGGGLAAGIRNALFESDSVKAGSFRPDVVVQAQSPTTSSTAVVEDTTTTTASTAPSTTTSTVRSRTSTTAAGVTTTTVAVTTTTTVAPTTSTTQENRGRGRGKPPDD